MKLFMFDKEDGPQVGLGPLGVAYYAYQDLFDALMCAEGVYLYEVTLGPRIESEPGCFASRSCRVAKEWGETTELLMEFGNWCVRRALNHATENGYPLPRKYQRAIKTNRAPKVVKHGELETLHAREWGGNHYIQHKVLWLAKHLPGGSLCFQSNNPEAAGKAIDLMVSVSSSMEYGNSHKSSKELEDEFEGEQKRAFYELTRKYGLTN